MATTSKNAYEIRSDLLGLAKQLADFNYSTKSKRVRILNQKRRRTSSTRV
jgi:hypothetical protein